MNAKTFFKYFASLFLIIVISIFVLFLVCYITVFKDKYVIRQIKNNDYYSNIQQSIKKSINGLEIDDKDKVISIIDMNMIEEDVNNYVKSIYNKEAYSTHSGKIDSLLTEMKVREDDRNTIISIYEREIRLNNSFNLIPSSIFTFMDSAETILVMSFNILVISYLYLAVVCKFKNNGILILMASMCVFLIEVVIHRVFKLNSLQGWFNDLYVGILNDICLKLIMCGVLLFIGGLILYWFEKVVTKKE